MAYRDMLHFSLREHANIARFAARFFRANGHPLQGIHFLPGPNLSLMHKELEFICPVQKCSLSKIKPSQSLFLAA
jgi:hypothetical protein